MSKKIQDIVLRITKSLPSTGNNISLMDGSMGRILFKCHVAEFLKKKYLKLEAEEELYYSFNKLIEGTEEVVCTYADGLAGFGWGLIHLNKIGLINEDLDILLGDIDKLIKKSCLEDIKEKDYDFLHGSIGKAYYLLNRDNQECLNTVKEVIHFLDLCKVNHLDGILWKELHGITSEEKGDYINLSLSHGLSSIIIFLAKFLSKFPNHNIARRLLIETTKYLRKQELTDESISLYPSYIKNNLPKYNSRLGWCYGDLGIALAFLSAGKILSDDNLINLAIRIGIHASNRRTSENTFVSDTSLCHGTSGIALIFQRLYLETNHPTFLNSHNFWIQKTLEFINYNKNEYKIDDSLLEGQCGVGMCLISSHEGIKNNWDSMFLIS